MFSDEEKRKLTEQHEAAKTEMERKSRQQEQELDEQRRQMGETFDELMKRRESEAKEREEDHRVASMKAASDLSELMRQHEGMHGNLLWRHMQHHRATHVLTIPASGRDFQT